MDCTDKHTCDLPNPVCRWPKCAWGRANAADRIQELERSLQVALAEKNMLETTLSEERTEADTLARALQIAHVIIGGRATPREQEFLNEALTIANRRVNGE